MTTRTFFIKVEATGIEGELEGDMQAYLKAKRGQDSWVNGTSLNFIDVSEAVNFERAIELLSEFPVTFLTNSK